MTVNLGAENGKYLLGVLNGARVRSEFLEDYRASFGKSLEQFLSETLSLGRQYLDNPFVRRFITEDEEAENHRLTKGIIGMYATNRLINYFSTLHPERRLEFAEQLASVSQEKARDSEVVKKLELVMKGTENYESLDYALSCICVWTAATIVYSEIMKPAHDFLKKIPKEQVPELLEKSLEGSAPMELQRYFPERFRYVADWMMKNLELQTPILRV